MSKKDKKRFKGKGRLSRRHFLQLSGIGFASTLLPVGVSRTGVAHGQTHAHPFGATAASGLRQLDPVSIPKYVDPLVIPPVMEPVNVTEDAVEYEIAVRPFQQQILPADFPATPVFGYGNPNNEATFNFPAFTVETRTDQTVRVTWMNQLVDDPSSDEPNYVPHLLPVDQTLHWANPNGDPDTRGEPDAGLYTGPVPIITHVHGAHVPHISDGYPEAWYLPNAANLDGHVEQGSLYASVDEAPPGSAIFEYPNDQRATTLWYHDHTLGMTRLNVYAGMAGFWLLRDDVEDGLNLPGPAPQLDDEAGTSYYEIPIVIQDRIFNEDGSLFYPDSREFFDGYTGPFMPETPVSPTWNPEFFGDVMVVNGKSWPYLEVEPRAYRFRLLNGTNSRFMILKFDNDLTFVQIGSDGGLLPDEPVELESLLMAPAERADVIVDFSQFEPGTEIVLLNLGPDEPFGGLPIDPEVVANPDTTGQIMQFRVVELTDNGNVGAVPAQLPAIERLSTDLPDRILTLNEELYDPADIPVGALLGTGAAGALTWSDEITENPELGATEIWTIANLTVDAHPIHLHLVQFQVLDRIPFRELAYHEAQEAYLRGDSDGPPNPLDYVSGEPQPPRSWEMGWKDTVIAEPGQLTRVIATFDLPGLYVWHCHILEHEDNEMMRPMVIGGGN